MKTAVYIAGSTIWVCSGSAGKRKIKVGNIARGHFDISPDTDRKQALGAYMKAFWKNSRLPSKSVCVVLDSALVQTKTMHIPSSNEKETISMVKNEFLAENQLDDSGEPVQMLYDYTVLDEGNKKDGGLILAAGVPRAVVAEVLEICKAAKIYVSGIDIALTSVIRLASMLPELRGGTYILGILNDSELQLMLFIDGKYMISNSAVLTEERGTPAVAVEVARNISTMLQFNMAQRTDAVIQKAYISGMTRSELELAGSMSEYLDIDVQALPSDTKAISVKKKLLSRGENITDYLFALGGLTER